MPRKNKGKRQRSKKGRLRTFSYKQDEGTPGEPNESSPMQITPDPPANRPIIETRGYYSLQSVLRRSIRTLAHLAVWPFRRVSKFVVVCTLLSIVSVSGFFYLRQNHPITIDSNLNQVDDIELNFRDYQSQDISPLCGCYREQRAEDWRGITFATRHVSIDRKGKQPITGFYITSTMPEKIDWRGNGIRESAELYSIVIPKNETFNPQLVLSNQLPESYRLIDSKHFDPQRYFMFFSHKELNIDLLGDKPLGAWIPSDGSITNIKYSKGMFPAAKLTGTIDEHYTIHESQMSLTQEVVGVPLGDFLGPNIVLWSEDNDVAILAGKRMIFGNPPATEGKRITVLVPKPPFSLRVACLPLSEDAVDLYNEITKDEKDTEEDYLSGMMLQDDFGTVHVSIGDVQEQAQEFAEVYNRMKQNDIVTIYNIYGDFIAVRSDEDPGVKVKQLPSMKFRYPPIPPNPGFNIFGSFSHIKFNSATGSVLLGSQPLDIKVPSTFELQDITALSVKGGVIPIQWSTAKDHTNIQLKATARVFLNGEPVSRGFEAYKSYIEYGLVICSIVSAIGAILQVVIAQRSSKYSSVT